MPSATPPLNVGGVQPPYDPISSAAGSIQAVNPNELTITAAGTLQFISGPTVPATDNTHPFIVDANTANLGTLQPNNHVTSWIIGADGANTVFELDTYGGVGQVRMRRADGTAGALSAVLANDVLAQFQANGFNGVNYGVASGFIWSAIENFTTAAQGMQLSMGVTKQGTTANAGGVILSGSNAAGTKVVQVTGGLSIDQAGTFVANGATAVTIAASGVTASSAIIISKRANGGTPGAVPQVGTITAGTNFTVSGTALDTSTYNYAIIN